MRKKLDKKKLIAWLDKGIKDFEDLAQYDGSNHKEIYSVLQRIQKYKEKVLKEDG